MGSQICCTDDSPFLIAALSLPLSVCLFSFVVASTLRFAATINSVYRKLRRRISCKNPTTRNCHQGSFPTAPWILTLTWRHIVSFHLRTGLLPNYQIDEQPWKITFGSRRRVHELSVTLECAIIYHTYNIYTTCHTKCIIIAYISVVSSVIIKYRNLKIFIVLEIPCPL